MNRIEFLGASGVGKTYLFNQVLSKRTEHNQWITPGEARVQIVKNLKHRYRFDAQSLKIALVKTGLFKKNHDGFTKSILKKYENRISFYSDYNGLIDSLLQTLISNVNREAIKTLRMIKYYYQILFNDVAVLDYFDINQTIVYHDGIIHNNAGINDLTKYQKIICVDPYIYNIITPKGVVYCKLSLEDNFNRRKKRISEGNATSLEKGLDDEKLYKLCERSQIAAQKKVAVMKSAQVPVLEVDTTQFSEENIEAALQFIRAI